MSNGITRSAIPPEIRRLPVPERIHLVEEIWGSIAEDEAAFELTAAQEAESDRRPAALLDKPAAAL